MQKGNSFKLIALGVSGGPFEDNASGYLLAPFSSHHFVALDAGSLLAGLQRAIAKNQIGEIPLHDDRLSPLGVFFLRHISAYLISHPHLDHVLGLVIGSQVDGGKKTILGTDVTIDAIRDHLFNGIIWPNCGSEGKEPLGLYTYQRLKMGKEVVIPGSGITVEPFPLSHPGSYQSTAFLIQHEGKYVLYFGDTAADSHEKEKHIHTIWKKVAPLLKEGSLKGIMLECSYPADAGETVFGHLDSTRFLRTLRDLRDFADHPLNSLSVVVTHRKANLEKGPSKPSLIADELNGANDLGCRLIFPTSGDFITF